MTTHRRDFMTRLAIGTCAGLSPFSHPALGADTPPLPDDPAAWTIYITNDTCPDYTWGYDEALTRDNFAELIRSHLDLMTATDRDTPPNRDRYNMAVTMEAFCFLEKYPDREPELVRRWKEGRIGVSPFLCNSLWGLQGVEGFLRTLYPARRLERRWGVRFDVAEHIELPSLPWGVATLLAGCGIRWLAVPFYSYESAFKSLTCPPLFFFEGPDGSKIRVVMDPWACRNGSYAQGSQLLSKPEAIEAEWLPHYQRLGSAYPARAILASGTHSDTGPQSAAQSPGFALQIKRYNERPGLHPNLVNATLSGFCDAIDQVEGRTPFLPTIRGCFGHAWELWPVCLARFAAELREGERSFLTAESLIAVTSRAEPDTAASTRTTRERAEWCLAMLSDHAWNGTDDANRRENARLRRAWSRELADLSRTLLTKGWAGAGLTSSDLDVTVFNGLSIPRTGLLRMDAPAAPGSLLDGGSSLASQVVDEEGKHVLYAVGPKLPGFAFRALRWAPTPDAAAPAPGPGGESPWELESPFYRLRVDPRTGGLESLVHRATGAELVVPGVGSTLGQTTYCQAKTRPVKEQPATEITCTRVAAGPVLSRLRVDATAGDLKIRMFVTVYESLDQLDLDVRIERPAGSRLERLCQIFPVRHEGSSLLVETMGAVIRPSPQPEGDWLPGAETTRLAVQGFVEVVAAPGRPTLTIAPLDAFALRLNLGQVTFESLGDLLNEREVTHDQGGVQSFRFRYVLRAWSARPRPGESLTWSRQVASPMVCVRGRITHDRLAEPPVRLDPSRAIATCLKPADDPRADGILVRIQEVAGQSGPLRVAVPGTQHVFRTDLLERDREEIPIEADGVQLDLPAYGFACLRLVATQRQ